MEQEYQVTEKEGKKEITKKKYVPLNPRILNRSDYYLNHEEVKKIKETALTCKKAITYHAMICLMVQDLLSRNDVVNLKTEHIDFDRGEYGLIKLPEALTKKRQPRLCPLTAESRHDLIQLTQSNRKYVFMHKTRGKDSYRKYSLTRINQIIAELGIKAGVKPKEQFKHLNTHIFRRTGVVFAKERGIPRDDIRVIGGWANFKYIDEVYGTPSAEHILSIKNNWDI